MQLIFATNNAHKVAEMQAAIGNAFELQTLLQANIHIDIPEPHDSLEENADEKSGTIFRLTGKDCFAEDSGLEVYALGGAPGVKSARYAGEERSHQKNISKLLSNLEGKTNRRARFRTVISLILSGKTYQFEGVCEGEITALPQGDGGFGYDPVFCPAGADRTFGEMTLPEKEKYSHRKKAADQLVNFLRKAAAARENE